MKHFHRDREQRNKVAKYINTWVFLKTLPFKDHITHSPKNMDTKKKKSNEDQKLATLLSSTPWYVHGLSHMENKFDTAGNGYKLEKTLMVPH